MLMPRVFVRVRSSSDLHSPLHADWLSAGPFPKCGAMNDLRPHRVFLSNAFEPSEDEVDDFAAEERARKSSARSRGRAVLTPARPAPAPVKKEQKKVTLENFEISDLSDSDDDEMPDISSIVKSSAKKEEPMPTKKAKAKGEFGLDDTDEDELDSDEEYVLVSSSGELLCLASCQRVREERQGSCPCEEKQREGRSRPESGHARHLAPRRLRPRAQHKDACTHSPAQRGGECWRQDYRVLTVYVRVSDNIKDWD